MTDFDSFLVKLLFFVDEHSASLAKYFRDKNIKIDNQELAYAASAYCGPIWLDSDFTKVPIQWPWSDDKFTQGTGDWKIRHLNAVVFLLAEINRRSQLEKNNDEPERP